jgi:hypothetical protein
MKMLTRLCASAAAAAVLSPPPAAAAAWLPIVGCALLICLRGGCGACCC